jgi:hypothetical protein
MIDASARDDALAHSAIARDASRSVSDIAR